MLTVNGGMVSDASWRATVTRVCVQQYVVSDPNHDNLQKTYYALQQQKVKKHKA